LSFAGLSWGRITDKLPLTGKTSLKLDSAQVRFYNMTPNAVSHLGAKQSTRCGGPA